MMSGNSKRYPFTGRQWDELQQQALIFKYMASGMPVPPTLLLSITPTPFDSPHPQHQQHYGGWKWYGVGLGKKVDPEPGRCRRTDGKKWRCSKEAYSDSKYCERHMHRGKNRSRKPVEIHHPIVTPTTKNLSFFSSPTPLSQHTSTDLLLYSDYRNNVNSYGGGGGGGTYGVKEQVDEHPFFSSEPSAAGTPTSFSASPLQDTWPLTVSSSKQSRGCSALDTDYSYLQLHSLQYEAKQDEPQKTVHRFFDEWPPKTRDSWLDLEDKSSTGTSSLDFPI